MPTHPLLPTSPRPFLKWAGGKSQLLPQYIPYFPKHYETYYEPFLGGGAVFFHLQPSEAVLTDVNPELVNVYRCVRDHVEQLISRLAEHQQRHSHDYYYQIRASTTVGELDSDIAETCTEGLLVEKAARLIYLNKTCFNGLYRENSKGEFNVPIGKYQNPRICHPDILRSASVVLQTTRIEVSSFETVAKRAKSQDFVYFDPPYYPLSPTSSFTAYSRYSFNKQDQVRLRHTFAELAERGVKVMLSNSDCSFIRELYSTFKIHGISASRAINADAKRRGKISEVLVTSF